MATYMNQTNSGRIIVQQTSPSAIIVQPDNERKIILKGSGGLKGETGDAATITVGSTTTGEPGTSASVVNSGTSSDAVLDFVIPKGSKGDKGDTGATGATGPANTLSIGTVQKGDTAEATITGDAPNQTLNLTLPKGDKGDTGAQGPAGEGVVSGGTTGQVLTKKSGTNYDTEWTTPTTYSDFTGATSSVAGAHGLVPAPTTSDPDKFLKGDGTWGTPPGTTYTAGTGIDITNDVISIDDDVVTEDELAPGYITGEGTSITLPGTQGGRFSNVKLKGGTEQTTYSGKNLFNFVALNAPSTYGVTTSYANDVVSVTGTATKTWVDITPTSYTNINLAVGSTYTFSIQNINAGGGFTPNFRYVLLYSDGTTYQVSINNDNPSATPSFTIPKAVTGIRMWLGSTQNQSFNLTFCPQVESGSTATSYEPYVGGVPSPSPSYPQAIQTVTGEQTIAINDGDQQSQTYTINLGKNLFDKDNVNTINGYLSGNGTIVASSPDRVWWMPCQPNTTYTVQRMDNATLSANRFQLATTEVTPVVGGAISGRVGLANGTAGTVLSITTGASAKYLCMQLYHTSGSTTESTMLGTVQVEVGSTATSYASYFAPVELCKIGDYQDYIYKNNGTWYLHKVINRKVFTGSEYWAYESTYHSFRTTGAFSDIKDYAAYANHFKTFEAISNYYVPITWDAMTYNRVGMAFLATSSTYNVLSLYSTETSVDNFKSWLSSHNVVIYYPLATATDTPITGTLLDDLNAFDQATSYQGNTYITVSSVSPDLPATLSVAVEQESALPVATETSVGVVSVGDGLSITDGGVLSVDSLKKEVYSTEEQVIGTWIDGKPLYRKVINFGALPNATIKYVAHGLSDFRIRKIYGTAINPSNNVTFILPVLSGSFGAFVTMYTDAQNIIIDSGSTNRSVFTETYITLEYTKTTD